MSVVSRLQPSPGERRLNSGVSRPGKAEGGRRLTLQAIRRSKSRNCGLCVVYIQKYEATLLVGAWQREKQQNKLVE